MKYRVSSKWGILSCVVVSTSSQQTWASNITVWKLMNFSAIQIFREITKSIHWIILGSILISHSVEKSYKTL